MHPLKNLWGRLSSNLKDTSVIQDIRVLSKITYIKILILINFIMRIFFHSFFHASTPSTFAPDEGTYARLSEYVSNGFAVQLFPEYGPTLYNESKTLIIPSSVLIRIGFDPLESVRLVSSIYGFCVPIMTLLCLIALRYSPNLPFKIKTELSSPLAQILILVLFFLPSNILWSTLGLRESASQLWILIQTYLIIKIVLNKKGNAKTFIAFFILATVFSFASRPQTALLYCVIALFTTLAIAAQKRIFTPAAVVIISMVIGNIFASTPKVMSNITWTLQIVSEFNTSNVQEVFPVITLNKTTQDSSLNLDNIESLANILCTSEGQYIEVNYETYKCSATVHLDSLTFTNRKSVEKKIDSSLFEKQRNANRIGANSALAPSNCGRFDSFASALCHVSQLPYRLSAFLFRPFPIIDRGSLFLTAAGIENIVWLLMFLSIIIFLFRLNLRSHSIFPILSILLFIIFFSIATALYEGNLGTAFRHKSTIQSPLILLILLLLVSHKEESGVRRL